MTVDPDGRYLFVTDEGSPNLYVIDIDPFSSTFHQVIQTLVFASPGEKLAPQGLRGVAVSTDSKQLFVAAPGQDLFRTDSGEPGRILVASLLSLAERRRIVNAGGNSEEENTPVLIEPVAFDATLPSSIIEYGIAPYDITTTEDPSVILITDRVSDPNGVGVLRRTTSEDGTVEFEVNSISLVPFGMDPVQGREVQAFGVSNAQGIVFIPANKFKEVLGEHPSYAIVSAFNAVTSLNDSKKNPNLAPFFASYPAAGPDPSVPLQFVDSEGVRHLVQFPVGAGSNLGFIRNPLGDFENPSTIPRLVAGTNPVLNGFADDVAVSENGIAFVPMQSQDRVFAYDVIEAIRAIELAAKASPTDTYASRSQYRNVPSQLTSLVRGPLGQIPIDLLYPSTIVQAHYGFYEDGVHTGYGQPPKDPYNHEPNEFGPIVVGNLPRGIETQKVQPSPELRMVPTPYTQAPSLQSFPNGPQTVETGGTSVAEIHSGALHEEHALVTYQSQGASRGIQLHYDSLRAEPRLLSYIGISGLATAAKPDSKLVARATATMQGKSYASASAYKPTDEERSIGFRGEENFFSLPEDIDREEIYGASLWFDLRDADSGVYDVQYDFGLFREKDAGFVDGHFQSEREYLAVVNGRDSEFGAGWGISGMQRIYDSGSAILLVDGNGTEQIFLPPSTPDGAYTPISLDRSVLRKMADGGYERKLIDGTTLDFRKDGLLEVVRDRNGNETVYTYNGDNHLEKIIDPVGLETVFSYENQRVVQVIDPAGRVTKFEYENNNLVAIIDPDSSKRTFEYDTLVPEDENIEPYQHLLTGQVQKRGNDTDEPLPADFHESIQYNDFGRVIGGTRVDNKSFVLSPAQMLIAATPLETADVVQSPELVPLLGKPPESSKRLEKARIAAGLTTQAVAGSVFTAEAIYTDFDGRKDQFQMDGFGSFTELANDKPGRAFGRTADNGLIGIQVDQIGTVTSTLYDDFGNVLSITDFPDGPDSTRKATVTFEYENTAFPAIWTRKVDSLGRETTRTLDDFGNIIREQLTTTQSLPQGNATFTFTNFVYYTSGAADGLVHTIEDANHHLTEYFYDDFGRLIETKHVDGSEMQVYDDLTGNVHHQIDADGFALNVTYDEMNRFKGSTVTIGIDNQTYSDSVEYDAAGNLIQEIDRNGVRTSFTFDLLNRVSKRIEAVGTINATTEYAYEYGEMQAAAMIPNESDYSYRYEKDPNGHVSLFVEDELGNPRYNVDAAGHVTKFLYNDAYQLIGTILPDGGKITMTLDGRGRVIEQLGPTTEKTQFVYDDDNHVLSQTVFNAATGNQTTQHRYNLFGTLAETTDAEGHVTRIEHDATNTPRKVIVNATGLDRRVTELTLDDRNRTIEMTENGLATFKKEFYPSGRVKSETNAEGAKTQYFYDEVGRTVKVIDAEGKITHFFYDGVGNEIATVDGRANGDRTNTEFRIEKEYDDLNRLVAVTNQEGDVTRFEFDKVGNQTKIIDPRSTTANPIESRMEYDAGNRLRKTTNAEGHSTTYFRDALNNVERIESQRINADGLIVVDVTQHKYDKSSRLMWTIDAVGRGPILPMTM